MWQRHHPHPVERMAVSGDIAVGSVVGVLFDLIGAVALNGHDSGGGYLYHDSRMANLASGLENT